jgi:NTE family protein
MKVGLALSGGGVLSAAHLGVLRELEKHNIKPDIISGASSGAVIGALYADGGIPSIEAFLTDMRNAKIFKRGNLSSLFPRRVFAQIRKCLEKNLKAKNFEELKTKFICVATDFLTGEPVYLSEGNIVDSVMASSAYLAVFSVQEVNGRHLVDGGISRNLPATILKAKGMDFVIGSSLHGVPKINPTHVKKRKYNWFKMAFRAVTVMQHKLAEYESLYCDFCFFPPVSHYHWYSFDHVNTIRKVGYEYAEVNMPALLDKFAEKKKELAEKE